MGFASVCQYKLMVKIFLTVSGGKRIFETNIEAFEKWVQLGYFKLYFQLCPLSIEIRSSANGCQLLDILRMDSTYFYTNVEALLLTFEL